MLPPAPEAPLPSPPTVVALTRRVKIEARRLGFDLVGIWPAGPLGAHAEAYARWARAGYEGTMAYMTRREQVRGDPRRILPEVRSVVTCGMNYHARPGGTNAQTEGPSGTLSRYAWGDDYHDVLERRLRELLSFVQREASDPVRGRIYVDTGPVLERAVAMLGGLGWIGKNTVLLNKRLGSWLFLGEILLTCELTYDPPATEHCGTCTRCLEACPTDAFPEPWVLDARRCISYLTIELRGPIPRDLRPQMGDRIFGCDDCQDVCPWNHRAPISPEPAFASRPGFTHPDLIELLGLDDESFRARFRKSPVKRTKRRGLLRNVAVALGNSGDRRAVGALIRALDDSEPLVRGHVAWALGRLGGEEARAALQRALGQEEDPDAREEIALALAQMERGATDRPGGARDGRELPGP
jgi:epoxyqueuosine reductase